MTNIIPPTYTDDAGDGQSGTAVTKAFLDAWAAAINTVVHSSTNPTITPEDIIDEVVTARGSKATLDTRLDVVLNEDGTLKTQASLVTVATAETFLGAKNLAPNSDFLMWPLGDAAAPAYWSLSGAGAAVARTGPGLGDTTQGKYGTYAAKITFGSATAVLSQTLLGAADFSGAASGLKGRKISVGAWIKTSIANHAQLVISDGVTSTSATHTGSGNFEWTTLTHTISASATSLTLIFQVIAAGSAYVAAVMPILADLPPADFQPCQMQSGYHEWKIAGAVTTGTDKDRWDPPWPVIVTDVQLECTVSPTGQPLIVDVNTWDGGAFTSMFSTRPQVAAGLNRGGAAPDTTYARKCTSAIFNTTLVAGGLVDFDVDQVGSGAAGSNLTVQVRYRKYIRPLESFMAYNS